MARAYNIRSISKLSATLALGAAVTLGATACGEDGNPGTAFFVNGEAFSEQALTETLTQWEEISGVDVPRDQMVGYLVETNLRLQAADAVGVGLSDEDVQQTLEGSLAELGGTLTADEIKPPVRDMFRDLLLINTVRSGEVSTEDIAALDAFITDAVVNVNPRYGSFTEGTLQPPGDLPGTVGGNLIETMPLS